MTFYFLFTLCQRWKPHECRHTGLEIWNMTNLCFALFSNSKLKKLQASRWITVRFPWVTYDPSERFILCFWKLLSQASNCLLVLSVQFKPNNCKHTHSYIILKLLILKGSCFLLEEKEYFLIKRDSEWYEVWPITVSGRLALELVGHSSIHPAVTSLFVQCQCTVVLVGSRTSELHKLTVPVLTCA